MKLKLRKVFIKKINNKLNLFISILGEIYELKAELNSDKRDRKKEAVKKVIHFIKMCFFILIFFSYRLLQV
jgi:hypothetical protein